MDAKFTELVEQLNGLDFKGMYGSDFLHTWDKTTDELKALYIVADALRQLRENNVSPKIFDSGLAVSLFRDNSTRTRFSFSKAANLLGLELQDLDEKKSQIAHGETVRETATMISFMADVIGIRDDMYIGKGDAYMAEVSESVQQAYEDGVLDHRPTLISLQSDSDHPTQSSADMLYLINEFGGLENLKGKKAIIVSGGSSMRRGGFLQDVEADLKEAGMDALTHCMEAYVSTFASMFTDANALHGIREIVEWLPKSYAGDKEARQHMHEAQCIAGIAFSSGLLGIVHSMAHKTGAAFENGHIIHGAANAMYLGKVIQWNSKDPRAAERYAFVAKEVLHLPGETNEELVAALVQKIRDMNDALNIPQSIKDYANGGVKVDAENPQMVSEEEFLAKLPEIAANAETDACTPENPRETKAADFEKILKACYYDTDIDF